MIQRKTSGTTLLETLVAATVVLLVLLSLLGTIAFGLHGTRNAEGHQDAVYHAIHLLELIRERRLAQTVIPPNTTEGFLDAEDARIALEDQPFADDFPPQTGYTRRIVTEQVSSDTTDYRSRTYRIEVTVFWNVKDRENSFRLVGLHRVTH